VIASSERASVAISTNEEWLLISARDRHDVLAELDEAAARGYRFVAMSWESHEFGASGLNCLLHREEDPPRQYRFVGGGTIGPKEIRNKLNEHARNGFRVLPSTVRFRFMDYWFESGAVPFLIMESSRRPELLEYDVVTAFSPDALIRKLRERCRQGFQLTAVNSGGSYWMMILERSVEFGEAGAPSACELGHLEIIDALKRKNLRKKLLELTSRGYRILAITEFGFRGGSRGGILLEHFADSENRYEHGVPEVWDDSVEDLLTAINAAGAAGFRLHWISAPGWFSIMEKSPFSDTRYEYRSADRSTSTEMLDAISSATDEGYQVILLLGDSSALLERETCEARQAR